MLERGLIQVYTGDGKGKTTAALGLALRAVGHGLQVKIIQFSKGSGYTGELFAAPRLSPNLEIYQFGWGCPLSGLIRSGQMKCNKCGECFRKNRDPELNFASKALDFAWQCIQKGGVDLLILDEISHPLRRKLISMKEVDEFLQAKPEKLELVLTGRGMPAEILEYADLITEMREVRHPFQKGVESRRGIDF